jgi:large subunit ribosomal protein L22
MEAEKKLKKSVRIRIQKEAAALAGNSGPATSQLHAVPTSPRKMRLVANMVRGKNVQQALGMLKFEPNQGAARVEQLLLTAIADWSLKNEGERIEDADLYVKTVFVDGGRMMKRLRPAPQGRGHRIRKRSNHVTLVVDSRPVDDPKTLKKQADRAAAAERRAKHRKAAN